MTEKILKSEIEERRISALPTRPTAPTEYGGAAMSASELKAAFDRLPELAIERLNSLIDDITAGELTRAIPTGNGTLITLSEVISGIESGALAAAMTVMGQSLTSFVAALRADVDRLMLEGGVANE